MGAPRDIPPSPLSDAERVQARRNPSLRIVSPSPHAGEKEAAGGQGSANMAARGSPKLNLILSKVGQSKSSPKGHSTKKHGGSPTIPRGLKRASWNSVLEKSLVELLHEHNTPDYRGQNGWSSEAWNKIVKEFHERNTYVSYTKIQIQEKEKELKREYRMIKEARKQSGTELLHRCPQDNGNISLLSLPLSTTTDYLSILAYLACPLCCISLKFNLAF